MGSSEWRVGSSEWRVVGAVPGTAREWNISVCHRGLRDDMTIAARSREKFLGIGGKGFVCRAIGVVRSAEKLMPVKAFTGFFQGNVHLVGKVGFTLGVFGFAHQRTTCCPGSEQLLT